MSTSQTIHAQCRHRVVALVGVAFLVVGCSSGVGNGHTTKNNIATTSSVAIPTGGTSCSSLPATTIVGETIKECGTNGRGTYSPRPPSQVVGKLGMCPQTLPRSLGALNLHVRGLTKREVPIRALTVRVCEYGFDGRLLNGNDQGPIHASRLADETNQLSTVSPGSGGACPSIPPTFFVTFAGQTQLVNVMSYHCGAVVNGAIVVYPTMKWFNDLYANLMDGRVGGPTG